MDLIYFLLFVAALACFLIAAFSNRQPRVNMLALGLAFWVLVSVIHALPAS